MHKTMHKTIRTAAPAALLAILALILSALLPAEAAQIGDLPGEDVSAGEVRPPQERINREAAREKRSSSWLSPPVQDQLARDRTLIPLGKGAIFVPTFTEPRREPEVSVFTQDGEPVITGQTGERILVDSGIYAVRVGSGTLIQRIRVDLPVEEGHTKVAPVLWGGLIVETLTKEGEYIDAQYEVVRMESWTNYGKGHGLKEERLQDIRTWILPPGNYRISKPGEGYNSLRNYITVQINAGELSQVELIYDKEISGDIVSGGLKSLNTRVKLGRNWSFGLRAGGNINLTRVTDDADIRKEGMQVFSDLRLKASFDNVRYLGATEILLQDNFSKERGKRFNVTSDIAEVRTTWVRRLNNWLGTYIRGTANTNIFLRKADKDTVAIATLVDSSGTLVKRLELDTSGDFTIAPAFDPINLREGLGVNVELYSKYYLEATTQLGFAALQTLVDGSYAANSAGEYTLNETSYEIGAESNFNATLRLGSQMVLDLRLEMFAPNANLSRLRLLDLTADFRFFLSRNLEVGYLYQVQETRKAAKNRFPSSHSISLRLSFNY